MRKYVAILLAAVLALTLSVMASAAPAKGDVNGIGGITLDDVQALYEYLTHGTIPSSAGYTAADILNVADYNNDGAVNILDYQALYVYVVAKNNSGSGGSGGGSGSIGDFSPFV